jgi:enoyl-CoA hydratase/carnithine racemase
LITLNRPKALNALCNHLLAELATAFEEISQDKQIGCVVITGSTKAFAGSLLSKKIFTTQAGADIKEMAPNTFVENYTKDLFSSTYHSFSKMKKPVIAAVNGYALGGLYLDDTTMTIHRRL